MGGLQAGGDAPHQLEQRLERQRTFFQNIRQRPAFDELHGEVGPLQRRLNRENVIADDGLVQQMVERRRLFPEQRQSGRVFRHLRQQHLDCHGGAGLDFVAFVDLAHATGADHALDFVNSVETRTGGNAAIMRAEWQYGVHDCHPGPNVTGDLVGSDERGNAANRRTTITVTLSRPPRSSARSSMTSQAACALRPAAY
jgi:hypothetical protein